MNDSYPIPGCSAENSHESSLTIKRSRFLTHIARTSSPEEAKAFIARMQTAYSDATHNCWAYVAGPPGSTAQIGASDDGEPHGTAGRPMLQVLLYSGVGEICAVVTRWFGGIKLGTGGLVKAYQDSVSTCLETLPTEHKTTAETITLVVSYAEIDKIHRLADRFSCKFLREDYAEQVTMDLSVPGSQKEALARALSEATDGRIQLSAITQP